MSFDTLFNNLPVEIQNKICYYCISHPCAEMIKEITNLLLLIPVQNSFISFFICRKLITQRCELNDCLKRLKSLIVL